jgi:hypothetical protein
VFCALEPVMDNINERSNPPAGIATRFGFRTQRSEWFRVYRVRFVICFSKRYLTANQNYQDFFLPEEAYDLYFFRAKVIVLCSKGFEMMDLLTCVTASTSG